jgi:hypothetical protein
VVRQLAEEETDCRGGGDLLIIFLQELRDIIAFFRDGRQIQKFLAYQLHLIIIKRPKFDK